MRSPKRFLAYGYLAALLVFIYLPILVMMAMGFNESPNYQLPFRFSLVWYQQLSGNEILWRAGRNSLLLAASTTIVATVIGTMAAIAFSRYKVRGHVVLQLLLFPPMAVPWLILATAMLICFYYTGIGRGLHAMLLAHVALALPYVIVVIGARLQSFGSELEEAASTLGASAWQTFFRVTLPVIAPGVAAAALFAFGISFDQFVTSYFLSPPGVTTLPVEIYASIRKGFTPEINAISTIIIIVSMLLLLMVSRFYRFGGTN
ncbi:spermidine/putrescine transport system permease protein [Rhodoligotrophos appendicifer]|uniref:ABC transporter permease n=1 Tax=Rhodoligotrophos appendicifer TaxID=987056 RepID=UPI0011855406|nr:ABC transporter permease [Rhodoligotrophos appendicifer]